ncbi:hypothetical protein [Pseudaeromonas paramecii]|uniref:DUF3168 domain-containing protein n=1 Tax=Pseudaeromonas paramecii TaxID=2138166 RepID=A0ABP8PUT5_9GAMM
MSMTYSLAIKQARANILASALAANGQSTITLYTGVAPDGVGEITDQAAVVTLTLDASPVASVESGVITLVPIEEQMILVTDTVGWARLADGAGTALADLAVGLLASGADLALPTLDLIAGSYLRLSNVQIREA